ncbi:hypothetical protein NDU88_002563 [Pleurodeles waltl]|uniref:Uncharacterized protein n=1 Tax=Pleurodeles waltl TaxID=8319 RepID=A0AAV7KT44_PLEWA|nr:hypothetical protein NDU88_002563 [Pleurodeles waltl]
MPRCRLTRAEDRQSGELLLPAGGHLSALSPCRLAALLLRCGQGARQGPAEGTAEAVEETLVARCARKCSELLRLQSSYHLAVLPRIRGSERRFAATPHHISL